MQLVFDEYNLLLNFQNQFMEFLNKQKPTSPREQHKSFFVNKLRNQGLCTSKGQRDKDRKSKNMFEEDKQNQKQQIKKIIQINEQYFRNKMKVSEEHSPNRYTFKIPSKTGKTMYEKNFFSKQKYTSKNQQKISFHQNKLKIPFQNSSTYQAQYQEYSLDQTRRKKKSQDRTTQSKAPLFLQTQYHHNYVNWGGNDETMSMKPQIKSAATNLPFQANSVYRTEFSKKPLRMQKKFKTTPLNVENKNEKKAHNRILFTTTHKEQFQKRMIFKEESYKPNLKTTNGLSFHGKTEYQGSFLEKEEKKEKKGDDKSELTLNQLQNFIIDL